MLEMLNYSFETVAMLSHYHLEMLRNEARNNLTNLGGRSNKLHLFCRLLTKCVSELSRPGRAKL